MDNYIKSKNRSVSPGFTLIEMLMVVALLGFSGYMIYGALNVSRKLYDKSLEKTESLQQLRFAINTISRDVQNVVRTSSGSSLVGIDGQFQLNKDIPKSDLLSLNLFPFDSMLDISGRNSFVTVKYFADYDAKDGLMTLKKVVSSNDNILVQRSKNLCKNIIGINFRYFKDGAWSNNWDSRNLPDAIEITVAIDTKVNKSLPKKLQTVVSIIS